MNGYQCNRCQRSSLVRSNFKFTYAGECVCVVCWPKRNDVVINMINMINMHENRTPECRCLDCGTMIDSASAIKDDVIRPKPGDITVCVNCGHIMAFNDDITVRMLTDDEMFEIAGRLDIIMIRQAIAQANKRRSS